MKCHDSKMNDTTADLTSALAVTEILRYIRNQFTSFAVVDAQINNCSSICKLIFTYTSTLISQTDRCSWHPFSVFVGYRIFSHAQNFTSLSGLHRSSNIAASVVLTVLPLSSLPSVLIILHRLNLHKLFCIILINKMVLNSWVLPTQL
jgi:hypothetical protein